MSSIFHNSISSFFINDVVDEAVILDGDDRIKVYGYEGSITDNNNLGEYGLTTTGVEFVMPEYSLPKCGVVNKKIILNEKVYKISSLTKQNGFANLQLIDGQDV